MKLADPSPYVHQNEMTTRNRDDVIRYRIVRRKTLVNETVRVTVHVDMLVSAAIQDTARVRADILSALRQFIKEAPWALSVIERNTASVVGYEQIVTTASATIPARENFNLPGRAHLASRQGLVLKDPFVDYRLPPRLVEQAVHDLRMETMQQVRFDIEEYTMVTGRPWRLGEIRLGQPEDKNAGTLKGAQRNAGYHTYDYGDEFGEAGSTECITLITDVNLCSDQAPASSPEMHEFVKRG